MLPHNYVFETVYAFGADIGQGLYSNPRKHFRTCKSLSVEFSQSKRGFGGSTYEHS